MSTTRVSRVLLVALWVLLVGASIVCAPASDGGDGTRILAYLQLRGEPITVATFNALGLWPLVFAAVLLREPESRVPIWPFVLASFFAGAFALIPGLVVRRWHSPAREPLPSWRRWITGRAVGALVGILGLALFVYAVILGSPSSFWRDARSSMLVSVMSLDFATLCLVWPIVLFDDARRYPGARWRLALGLVPLIGPPLWLIMRGEATTSSSLRPRPDDLAA